MYLDPGFGGMLVQIIIAVAAGVGALGFIMRKKIKSLFSKGKPAPGVKADEVETEDVIDVMDSENP